MHSCIKWNLFVRSRGMKTKLERIDKLNWHLCLKANLNSSLFSVLDYKCPPPTYTQEYR